MKITNGLRLIVFEDLEVFLVQIGDKAAFFVGHRDGNDDFIHVDPNRTIISALFVRWCRSRLTGDRQGDPLWHIRRRNRDTRWLVPAGVCGCVRLVAALGRILFGRPKFGQDSTPSSAAKNTIGLQNCM